MTQDSELAKLYLDILPQSIHAIRKHMREIARSKMTMVQLRILANLYRGLDNTSQLADRHGVSMPAMSKMIDNLVSRDMIRRETNPKDRRQIHLSLSKLGMKTYLEIRKTTQTQLTKDVSFLSAVEKQELKRGLLVLDKVNQRAKNNLE